MSDLNLVYLLLKSLQFFLTSHIFWYINKITISLIMFIFHIIYSVNDSFLGYINGMSTDKFSDEKIKSWVNDKNCEKIAKDVKRCLKFTLEHEDLKPADVFYHILIKQGAYDSTCENN